MIAAFIVILLAVLPAVSQEIGTTNKVLMVDQDNMINVPEVLATQAQMSSNETALAIANAKADAADRAAREGTNMVNNLISQIASNELTIYRIGFVDSITSDVTLPPDTECVITGLTPSIAVSGGKIQHKLKYATTRPADGIKPDIFFHDTLAGGRSQMMALPADDVQSPTKLGETYEKNGTVYGNVYEVTFLVPASGSGFFFVYLDGDASSSGSLFNIIGGVGGGSTTNITFGSSRKLVFRGGLLVGVEE